ncbi:VaFE repeat-containing surface-anchored protein [Olsenella massiliensis]|uniref:VaFE repeat-containing surface-anchored protein n=1 Tax=Olsenella massiliensis TaxID=1622075 RepID=UPI00071DD4DC|nr:VaFE repeat-containing surface-anchored protein [Olsenella massiliensis]
MRPLLRRALMASACLACALVAILCVAPRAARGAEPHQTIDVVKTSFATFSTSQPHTTAFCCEYGVSLGTTTSFERRERVTGALGYVLYHGHPASQHVKGLSGKDARLATQWAVWRCTDDLGWNRFPGDMGMEGYVVLTDDVARGMTKTVRDAGDALYQEAKAWAASTANVDAAAENNCSWRYENARNPTSQALVVTNLEHEGWLRLTKASAASSITQDNGCYSLEGARFVAYADSACTHEVGTLTTKADGTANVLSLQPGRYWVREVEAPRGYALSQKTREVDVAAGREAVVSFVDEPAVDDGWALLKKEDEDTKGVPQGDAGLGGARFRVSFYDNVDGTTTGAPRRSWIFATNEDGWVDFGNASNLVGGDAPFTTAEGRIVMPLGSYLIQEVCAPAGYALPSPPPAFTAVVSQDGSTRRAVWHAQTGPTTTVPDEPDVVSVAAERPQRTGEVSGTKVDAERDAGVPQGDASLAGAVLSILNASDHPVSFGGRAIDVGAEVTTAVTNDAGAWRVEGLPYGTYAVVEKCPSPGYLPNSTWRLTLRAHEGDGRSYRLQALPEQVVRGDVRVAKVSCENGEGKAEGAATLEGAQLVITNRSTVSVLADSGELRECQPGAFVLTVTTNEGGVAQTEGKALPFGSYEVMEKTAPEGYLVNKGWKKQFCVREDGQKVELEGPDATVADQVKREGFHFSKKDAPSMGALPRTAFLVIAQSDQDGDGRNEAHVIVTDENGAFDSDNFDEGRLDNANDAAVSDLAFTHDDSGRVIADLDALKLSDDALDPERGVWFTGRTDLTTRPKPGRKAFPFDRYTVQELPCKANEGRQLVTFEVELKPADRNDGATVDLGTIDDHPGPQLRTSAQGPDGSKVLEAQDELSLKDAVHYTGLEPGVTYELEGSLHLRDVAGTDRGPLSDAGGTVRASRTFTPQGSSGTEELTFTFGGASLQEGAQLVAFETLSKDGSVVTRHEDIADAAQTVVVRASGRTRATAAGTGKGLMGASANQTIKDTVTYRGLTPGKTYDVLGTLHLRGSDGGDGGQLTTPDGTPVEARTSFTPSAPTGSVELSFSVDASSLEGSTLVAFETVSADGAEVFVHADIADEGQSIHIPAIHTTAHGETTEDGGIEAASAQRVVDTVRYENLVPGQPCRMTGTLHRRGDDGSDQGPVKDASGADLSSSVDFTPTEPSGYVDVVFQVDGSNLRGARLVAFEELSVDGATVASHADIDDEGQTVSVAALSTSARGAASGTHEEEGRGTTKIVDTVSYAGLTPKKGYILTGTLHVRADDGSDAGVLMQDGSVMDPARADLSQAVSASLDLTPEASQGSVDLEFTFDGTLLLGKTVVAFERLSHEGRTVAAHADVSDDEQAVSIPKILTSAETEGRKTAPAAEVSVTDRVSYENVTPGQTYRVVGRMVDQTGEALSDERSVEFKAEASAGSVDVPLQVDLSRQAGRKVVAFERLERVGDEDADTVVARHEDLTDEAQTVTVEAPPNGGGPNGGSPRGGTGVGKALRSLAQTGSGPLAWVLGAAGSALLGSALWRARGLRGPRLGRTARRALRGRRRAHTLP